MTARATRTTSRGDGRALVSYRRAQTDGVGHLTLTRPALLNATDDRTLADLTRAVADAAADARARAILVAGEGRAFCTGIDLKALSRGEIPDDWFSRWDATLARLEALAAPTIAVIQGPCLGGGLQIALCCDLRVAATNATFGLSAVKHGIIPGLATYRLPRLIGLGPAREMMLLGETWDAKRALRHGLVDRVVAAPALGTTARGMARTLTESVPIAVAATKRLVLRSYDLPLPRFLDEYVRAQRRCRADPVTKARLAGYQRGRWGR